MRLQRPRLLSMMQAGRRLVRSLARRGLRGVKLVISDDHKGLKAAATRILNTTWQRCRTETNLKRLF